jgi:hypothetical protein
MRHQSLILIWMEPHIAFNLLMKNKSMPSLQSRKLLLIFGMTVALLTLPSSQVALASVVTGSNALNSNQGNTEAARQLTLDAIRKIPTLAVAVLLLPTPIKKR